MALQIIDVLVPTTGQYPRDAWDYRQVANVSGRRVPLVSVTENVSRSARPVLSFEKKPYDEINDLIQNVPSVQLMERNGMKF